MNEPYLRAGNVSRMSSALKTTTGSPEEFVRAHALFVLQPDAPGCPFSWQRAFTAGKCGLASASTSATEPGTSRRQGEQGEHGSQDEQTNHEPHGRE